MLLNKVNPALEQLRELKQAYLAQQALEQERCNSADCFHLFFSSFFPILSRGPGSGAPRAGSLLGDSSAPAGAEGSGQRFKGGKNGGKIGRELGKIKENQLDHGD